MGGHRAHGIRIRWGFVLIGRDANALHQVLKDTLVFTYKADYISQPPDKSDLEGMRGCKMKGR
jgi:hypothetical protein